MLPTKRFPVCVYRLVYLRMRPHLLPVYKPGTQPTSQSASGSFAASPAMRFGSDVGMGTTRILIPSAEEISRSETKPFIQRTFSYTQPFSTSPDASSFHQKRRRRAASENSLGDLQSGDGGRSFQGDVGRAASDTYLIARLSFTLLRYLGVGYRWVSSFLALGCYSLFILPGIVQVGYQYFFSKQIRRGIVYGDQPRNKLDIYLPKDSAKSKPVIAFVTGGAWIIGYKAWGSLLGLRLLERDIIVVCVDYRNFPQVTISDMIQDASQGVSFICNHIAEYGGDPERIYLMGQSAGAHIGACVLLEQAIKEASGEKISWSVSQIKSYFGLSGGYNLFQMVDHLRSRGLYHSLISRIMEGEESFERYSPEVMVQDPEHRTAVPVLPPMVLYHGTADYSLPCVGSKSFAETLQNLGVQAEAVMYEGKTHTDIFLQDPMRGGRDDMFEDLVSRIHAGDPVALARDAQAPPGKRLVPEFMLKLARAVSPF